MRASPSLEGGREREEKETLSADTGLRNAIESHNEDHVNPPLSAIHPLFVTYEQRLETLTFSLPRGNDMEKTTYRHDRVSRVAWTGERHENVSYNYFVRCVSSGVDGDATQANSFAARRALRLAPATLMIDHP